MARSRPEDRRRHLRGTREGVPNLARMLATHGARATFLFSLGPDHTGWALRRVLRPGFLKKVSRTSVVEHYGVKTLMYGVLLPGPDIGAKARRRDARDRTKPASNAASTRGITCYWQDNVRDARRRAGPRADAARADAALRRDVRRAAAHARRGRLADERHAFAQLDARAMRYASDGARAARRRRAARSAGRARTACAGMRCIQMPTTLPTLDEVLGGRRRRIDDDNVAAHLLQLTAGDHARPGVHAARGTRRAETRAHLRATVGRLARAGLPACLDGRLLCDAKPLPRCRRTRCTWGEIPGRSGELIVLRYDARRGLRRVDTGQEKRPWPTSPSAAATAARPQFHRRHDRRPDLHAARPSGQEHRAVFLSEGQHARAARPKACSSATCHDEFQAAGAEIFGITRDSLRSHDNFKAKLELPFELISDPDEAVCTQFDVMKMKNMYGKEVRGIERSTFVIDADGRLVKEWRGVKVNDHVDEVLEFVKSQP